jgi:hypothetical protein
MRVGKTTQGRVCRGTGPGGLAAQENHRDLSWSPGHLQPPDLADPAGSPLAWDPWSELLAWDPGSELPERRKPRPGCPGGWVRRQQLLWAATELATPVAPDPTGISWHGVDST